LYALHALRAYLHNYTPALFLSIFYNHTPTTDIYTLSLTTLFRSRISLLGPTWSRRRCPGCAPNPSQTYESPRTARRWPTSSCRRSEEYTSELQSRGHLVCRLLLEKKKCIRDYVSNT